MEPRNGGRRTTKKFFLIDQLIQLYMSISQFSLIHPVKRGEDCAFPGAK